MSKTIDFEKPLSGADAEYVRDRPWLLTDAELSGVEVTFADDSDFEVGEDEDQEVDYSKLTVAKLQEVIEARNEEIEDEADHIKPVSLKKDDLIAALEADDAAQTE